MNRDDSVPLRATASAIRRQRTANERVARNIMLTSIRSNNLTDFE